MMEYGDLLAARSRRRSKASRFRPAALLLVPLFSILFQTYVPLFIEYLGYLELPLLVTVYFALMRRRPVSGLLYGAAIGLLQDSLSSHALGLYGIVKTLVGYFAATVSLRFEVDNPVARFIVASFFFFFHQFFYWVLGGALLGSPVEFSVPQTLLLGVMNGAVAVPLFHLLDKLKETG
jgi:rod shape-determining protein MreD